MASQRPVVRLDRAPRGLSRSSIEALFHLRSGPIPMRRISDLLHVKPAAVTGTVDRLVRTGLAVRELHPSDRRSTLVRLTSAGQRLVEEIFVVLREVQASN